MKKNFSLGPSYAIIASMIVLGGTQTAHAQLDTIIVTAQKKSESLQEIPIVVNAFSAERLEALSIDNNQDLQFVTPGLVFPQSNGVWGTPFIRGVGSSTNSPGAEPSVATFIDGVYQPHAAGSVNSIYGIERIEVLKGPQGTLYGRNATGGAFNITTRNPGDELEGDLSLSYGNFNAIEAKGYVGGPLSDSLGANLAVSYKNRDGFGTNISNPAIGGAGGEEVFGLNEFAIRSKVRFQPSDATDILLTGMYYSKDDTSAFNNIYPTEFGSIPAPTAFGANVQTEYGHDVFGFYKSELDADKWNLSATISQDFGDWTFKSITGYSEIEYSIGGSFDGSDLPVFAFNTGTPLGLRDRGIYGETFSQEVQVSRDFDKVSLLLGGFYFDDIAGFDTLNLTQGGVTNPTIHTQIDTEALAIFANASMNLTDQLKATAGIRYSDESKDNTIFDAFVPNGTGGFVLGFDGSGGGGSWDDVTYKFALDYAATDDLLLFGKYESGFKSGTINSTAPSMLGGMTVPGTVIDPETIDSFEAGIKSEWLDNKLRVNASAYLYNYKDLQSQFVDASSGSIVFESAEKAQVKGVEVDATALVTENLLFFAGLSLLDSEYKTYTSNGSLVPNQVVVGLGTPGNSPVAGQNLAGNALPYAPEFTLSLGSQWTIPLGNTGDLELSGNVLFSDSYYFEATNRVEQDAYTVANMQATFRPNGQAWSVGVWGKNITDTEYWADVTPNALGDAAGPSAPATYGVKVGLNF